MTMAGRFMVSIFFSPLLVRSTALSVNGRHGGPQTATVPGLLSTGARNYPEAEPVYIRREGLVKGG